MARGGAEAEKMTSRKMFRDVTFSAFTPGPLPLRRCPANASASPAGSHQRWLCAVAASHGGQSAGTAPEN